MNNPVRTPMIPAAACIVGMRATQESVAQATFRWSMQYRLYSSEQTARQLAVVIATFCLRCAPQERAIAAEQYQLVGRFLALFFHFDEEVNTLPSERRGRYRALLDEVLTVWSTVPSAADARPLPAQPPASTTDAPTPPERDPSLETGARALRAFLTELASYGPPAAFIQAFRDYLGAVWEEHDSTGVQLHGDALAELYRLRSLLIATQPYLRCWQVILGSWPALALTQALDSAALEARRHHPNTMLDRAVDIATRAHPQGATRQAPALSEFEALAVVMTYLANDIGSQAKDRDSGEINLVLLLSAQRAASNPATNPNTATADATLSLQKANESVRRMYNTAVARLQYLRNFLTQLDQLDVMSGHPMSLSSIHPYVSLITDIADGNLQGTRDLAALKADSKPDRRYVSKDLLDRLTTVKAGNTRNPTFEY